MFLLLANLKEIDLKTDQACEKVHLSLVKRLLELNPNIDLSNDGEYSFR